MELRINVYTTDRVAAVEAWQDVMDIMPAAWQLSAQEDWKDREYYEIQCYNVKIKSLADVGRLQDRLSNFTDDMDKLFED